jgi:histidine triad (HIT) family protein
MLYIRMTLCFMLIVINGLQVFGQSEKYEKQKEEKLAEPSPFESIISGSKQDQIVFQDDYVVAFVPLRKQAPVHLLIVPKKRVPTLNDATEDDAVMLGRLFLVAKKLAGEYGIDKTGYRVSVNTNEHAGQSVFHLHVHLVGGMILGPMVEQSYSEK